MKPLTNIIRKGLAAGVATAALLSLTASPASAAEFTTNHFTIDTDSMVVGRSTANNNRSTYKAFAGSFEAFHDGRGIAGRINGDYIGSGDLNFKFTWHDGGTLTQSFYSAGVQVPVNIQVPSQGTSLVRVDVTYVQNNPNPYITDTSMTYYTGDAPQSTGSCQQLDTDSFDVSNANASFTGNVKWACNASTGRVTARVEGQLNRKSGATKNSYIGGHIEYSDGTTTVFLSRTVTSSAPSVNLVPVNSDQAKHPRYVDISIFGDSSNEPMSVKKLGDA